MRRFFLSAHGWPYLLVPFIPIAIGLEVAHAGSVPLFITSALGVIPTAALMGRATEELAARSGPGIGGLLNVTFGNAPELIIALFALNAGLHEVVKASIIGSILGNILLVLGAAMFLGGLGRDRQTFDRTAASAQASMLVLAITAMAMPAIFEMVEGRGLPSPGAARVNYDSTVEHLSVAVAIVLILSYVAGLIFSLRTHRDLFNPGHGDTIHAGGPTAVPAAAATGPAAPSSSALAPAAVVVETGAGVPDGHGPDEAHGEMWSVRKAVGALALAGVAVGVMSEILVGSIAEAADSIGLSEFFVGVIVVAIVGNAAEHWVAVLVARKDQMDLAVNIAIGSSAQIALFVAPILVLTSFFLGPHPMALVFNGFELGAIFLAVLIAGNVTNEGESTWYEGVQLLAVYVVLALSFYFAGVGTS
ncbi:MAG: cax [Solirubrobacterales bacterium]|nr:cax [Solirubrobacterales bacterium]